MNPYYSGLGIARSLRGRGIRVYGLSSERDAPGVRSRYFHGIYDVPNGRDEPERLRDRLLEIRRGHSQRPVLFPTRDLDLVFLQECRGSLAEHYLLPQAEDSPILRVMDKLQLAAVASSQGIPTPRTAVCGSAHELARHLASLRFPLVVKPRFAYQWRRKGLWERVGATKAILVSSPQELRVRYRQLADVSPEVLLQEYVAGDDSDIVVCGCYINRAGEPLGHFTARKVKQNPPLMGTGSIVETAEISAIVPLSLELLRAFGYAGLAEIEFKYHKTSGKYFLIEVNPRHWDQHELGTLVGVNLSWIAYRDIVGMEARPASPAYPAARSFRWVAERELIESVAQNLLRELADARTGKARFARSLKALAKALGELSSLLKRRKICGLMKLQDPLPGVLMWLRLLRDGVRLLGVAPVGRIYARYGRRETIQDDKPL